MWLTLVNCMDSGDLLWTKAFIGVFSHVIWWSSLGAVRHTRWSWPKMILLSGEFDKEELKKNRKWRYHYEDHGLSIRWYLGGSEEYGAIQKWGRLLILAKVLMQMPNLTIHRLLQLQLSLLPLPAMSTDSDIIVGQKRKGGAWRTWWCDRSDSDGPEL